jgi:oligopeptide transport system permease protein
MWGVSQREGDMARMIGMRLLAAGPTLLLVAALGFALMRLAPGGPFDLERPLDPAALAALRRVYGLDAPLWRQFLDYLGALANGDLGPSFAWRDFTVAELFARALPVSAGIGAAALAVSWPLGIGLGLAAARRAGTRFDTLVIALASLGLTIPSFVLAPLFQLLFGLKLGWLPVGGTGGVGHYVLPVATLALPQVAAVARLTRGAMREALDAPSQRTALAYGLPERVRLARAFRAARLPLISYFGPAAASVLTGSVVVETLFGLPGVGRYFVEAALDRDYTVSLGAALLAALVVVTLNLVCDVVYLVADPRARR